MYKAIPIDDYYVIISNKDVILKDTKWALGENGLCTINMDGECLSKEIIAQSKPVHEGIPLFDLPKEWGLVDVEELAKECFESIYNTGFLNIPRHHELLSIIIKTLQFSKRAETHEWTDEEVGKYMEWISSIGWYYDKERKAWEHPDETGTLTTKALLNHYQIQSLKKPKVYEVQIEMEEIALPQKKIGNNVYDLVYRNKKQPKITNNKISILSWK